VGGDPCNTQWAAGCFVTLNSESGHMAANVQIGGVSASSPVDDLLKVVTGEYVFNIQYSSSFFCVCGTSFEKRFTFSTVP
jgi:hypothetical protein